MHPDFEKDVYRAFWSVVFRPNGRALEFFNSHGIYRQQNPSRRVWVCRTDKWGSGVHFFSNKQLCIECGGFSNTLTILFHPVGCVKAIDVRNPNEGQTPS